MAKGAEAFPTRGSLHSKTHALLLKEQRSLATLSNDLGIPFYWLQKFYSNTFKDPSVNRVQYLYEKLSGKTIQL